MNTDTILIARNLGNVHALRSTPRVHAIPAPLYGAAILPRDVFAAHAAETRAIIAHGRHLIEVARARMAAHAETRAWYVGAVACTLLTLSVCMVGQ
jgi:hypothetical protein